MPEDADPPFIGPGWYVIAEFHQDPARVVSGPTDRDSAESHAHFLSDPNAKIMHTPALVNAIQSDGYNVKWGAEADRPDALGPGTTGRVYRSETPTHDGYGMPRGPIATIPEAAPTTAIGFCPMCGANARVTCSNRGAFDCPTCTFAWYDDRVGSQTRSIGDYFTAVETATEVDSDA